MMIYNPGLYDYDWDVTIHEVGLCPTYPAWGFIEMCTTMHPHDESMALKPGADLVARCAWHSLEMQERLGPVDKLPYWECPECQEEIEQHLELVAAAEAARASEEPSEWDTGIDDVNECLECGAILSWNDTRCPYCDGSTLVLLPGEESEDVQAE